MNRNMHDVDSRLETLLHSDFHVGPWLVQPELNQLQLRDDPGLVRTLEPRIMLLLCVLATDAGKTVGRELLMCKLWPRVVVNENSLTRAVSELRKALAWQDPATPGSHDSSPIVTVPKKGYRLQGGITPADAGAPVSMAEVQPAAVQSLQKRVPRLQALAASLALTSGFLLWQGFNTDAELLAGQMASVDATATSQPRLPTANPNAEWIREQLRIQQAESITALATQETKVEQVPAATDTTTSVVSRDGQLVAYVSYTDSGSALVLGSQQNFSPINVYETEELIFNLQWSPVDNILLFAQKPRISPAAVIPEKDTVRLVMFDIATMQATVLQGGDREHGSNPFSIT